MPKYKVLKAFSIHGCGLAKGDTVEVSQERANKLGRMGYISQNPILISAQQEAAAKKAAAKVEAAKVETAVKKQGKETAVKPQSNNKE